MYKKSLLTKIVLPVLAIILIGFVLVFYVIDKSIATTVVSSTKKIVQNDINYIKNSLELKSSLDKSNLAKKSMQEFFTKHFKNSAKIVFIHTQNNNLIASQNKFNSEDMSKIIDAKEDKITINSNSYMIKKISFSAYNWTIYYVYNLKEQNNAITDNQTTIIISMMIFLLVMSIILYTIYKKYAYTPNKVFLKHFKDISNGKYELIINKFDIYELDELMDNFNKITKEIELREKEIKSNLQESEDKNAYIKDILNTQKSIVITKNNDEEIIGVNSAFFRYFDCFKDLDDFKKYHSSVTDFFVKQDGFIYKFEDKSWIDEIINDKNQTHKVKLDIYGVIYFFAIDLIKSQEHNHIVVILTDITDLENQKATLDQYDKIINKSLMVSRTDLDGKIVYANDKLLETTKYAKNELIGQNESILRSPDTPNEFYENMQKVVNEEKIWSGKIEKIDKYGEKFYVYLYLSPIINANHKIIGYMYLRQNITDLVKAREKARDAEQSKSMFLASMSHEIRTPLNAIIGFTKILTKSNIENKYKHYVNTIDQSAENLLSILNNILDISKIENNSLVLEKTEFNPFEEFNATVNLFYAKFNDKQINMNCFIDPKIPQTLLGDFLRIKQVLSNLISNAIKFTNEKGTISIKIVLLDTSEHSCKVSFSVEDSGIGIPKDKQAHIFTPYAQVDDSTGRVFGGTGLGLDICLKIIKLHGSSIDLQSKEGVGSKFSFIIDFDIDKDDNIVKKVENIKSCIIEFPDDLYANQYKSLKEYIRLTTKNIILNNTNNIELLKQQDIVFLCEESIDENILSLAQSDIKFAIFSTKLNENKFIKNYSLISSPIDVSQLFNILIEVIDGKITDKNQISYENTTNYEGNILIAEDHKVNQELISILLDLRGIKHALADDGKEAVEMFMKDSYDLVFMDINMPNKDGIEATKDIREYESTQKITPTPIIALTANALKESKEKMMENGMNGHLLKPLDENELDKILKKYLKKGVSESNDREEKYTIEQASKKMGIDSPLVAKIVQSFVKNIDSDMQNLEDGIKSNEFEKIVNFAHKIKGAALNLHMKQVGEIARTLEISGENKSDDNLFEVFEALKKEVDSIKDYAKSL